MATEYSSIARPYAEAVFSLASEKDNLETWSEMLEFMAAVVTEKEISAVIGNPDFDKQNLTQLLLEIGGGRINDECQNLVKLLVVNNRLPVLPEISMQLNALKNASEGAINVVITSAFDMKPAQEKVIADALKAKFSSEINISNETDSDLIGGVHIKAGDIVIDGSIKGQLKQLSNELGI